MKTLRRLWLRLFPQYDSLETMCVSYHEADQMIRDSAGRPEEKQWVICSRLEDRNRVIGICWLERRRRITE